jgi:hypothetical protein
VEEDDISHHGVDAWFSEIVSGRGHEEDLCSFFVEGDLYFETRYLLNVPAEVFDDLLQSVRRNTEVVTHGETVTHRLEHPVDVATHQMEELSPHHGHFAGVNPVGTEDRTATTFRTLIIVVEPFLDDVLGEFSGSCEFAKELALPSKLPLVDRSQELGSQNRHIFGISGAKKIMALVRTGPTTHADIHEELEGSILRKPIFHALQDELSIVRGQLPVII